MGELFKVIEEHNCETLDNYHSQDNEIAIQRFSDNKWYWAKYSNGSAILNGVGFCPYCGKDLNTTETEIGSEEQVTLLRKIFNTDSLGKLSDGYHTFNELYHHRAVLFSVICNSNKELAWKSKLHDTGDMYDGMFIVGIETPDGQATYHYDIDPYWEMFEVKELEKAPKWDGHTPEQAIDRIRLLNFNDASRFILIEVEDNHILAPRVFNTHMEAFKEMRRRFEQEKLNTSENDYHISEDHPRSYAYINDTSHNHDWLICAI